MAEKKRRYSHTAYDDAFRTIEKECSDALISFVNHMFHTKYDIHSQIQYGRNEHFIERKGRRNEKVVSDSYFSILGDLSKQRFHIECESKGFDSGSIMVRLFQYGVQDAISDSIASHNELTLNIPYIGLLVLRDKGTPPESVTFAIHFPGGMVSYEAPVVCMADYSLDELFEKKLYFLLPFFIFNMENSLSGYATGQYDIKEVEDVFISMIKRLEATPESDLSLRSKGVIIKQIESVAYRITDRKPIVQEKVGDIMGGKVLKMEWLERFDAAVAEGEAKGKAEGEAERQKLEEENKALKQEIEKLKAAAVS